MAARQDPPAALNPLAVIWGCIVALLLMCLFCYLKPVGSPVIDLPAQWLWVSLVPILLGQSAGITTADASLQEAYSGAMGNAGSLFLVHVFQPSKTAGQKYDVSVYLIRDIGAKS